MWTRQLGDANTAAMGASRAGRAVAGEHCLAWPRFSSRPQGDLQVEWAHCSIAGTVTAVRESGAALVFMNRVKKVANESKDK